MDNNKIDFFSRGFLTGHIQDTLAFYHPRCIDHSRGGFFHYFRNDGSIYDTESRHLVSSSRFIFNYAMAGAFFDNDEYRDAARHGLAFLRHCHRDDQTGGYAWTLTGCEADDRTNHCYGLAFVLLAYATALKAGLGEARAWLDETFELMEQHFWSERDGLYRDEISADWQQISPYRGQNANMHSCEALIAAYEATQDSRFLDRALRLAENICVRQAAKADGLIWEHYDSDWNPDWDYNRDNPRHLFRPWGFQTGHLTEWAKLLLILRRHRPEEWMLPRARELFDVAMQNGWDNEHGGLMYGFAPDNNICDSDKYFWVQAESFAAAALLADASGEPVYREWYRRIWQYAWEHMVDHRYGAWFRILDRQNNRYDDLKSPAGKTDYHTMGACYEVLNLLP